MCIRDRAETAPRDGRGWEDVAMTTVELTPEELAKLANRLRRAQGQIGGVLRMIEEGRECQDIVMQLSLIHI